MKKLNLFIFLFPIMMLISCGGNDNNKISTDVVTNSSSAEKGGEKKSAKIEFDRTKHDFGEVIEGEIVSYNFKFKNTGNVDLIIRSVNASCGCTIAKKPEKSIKPGQEEYLEVTFDSNRRKGFQHKTVTVLTNAQPSKQILHINAKIIKP